jgi:hypothetical protein
MTIDGTEYILSLNRKGVEAVEKYTKISGRKKELEQTKKRVEYVDEIKIGENPFEEIDDSLEEKVNENLEMIKRILWICLWDNHKLNIEEVRELLIKVIDEDKLEELNNNISKLVEGVNKQMGGNNLKNLKALKAQK